VTPRRAVSAVVKQLQAAGQSAVLDVEGHELPVSSLDKHLWPAHTKRDLLIYLASVSPWMLPHLDGRPVFVTRWPNGIAGKSFYQKVWENPPPFVKTVSIWSTDNGGPRDYLLCANLATLLWLGQQAALEFHVWFSSTLAGRDGRTLGVRYGTSEASLEKSRLNYPDFMVFDLDPYVYSGKEARGAEPELYRPAFKRAKRLAHDLREIAGSLGLEVFVKTSGRTGLHLYLPIRRRFDFTEVRAMAETIGRHLRARHPKDVTLEWAVEQRRGRIFFDYNQNVRGKSLAAAFSPRRHERATVSMPLSWDELADAYPTDFTIATVPAIMARRGDPWAGILDARGDLEAQIARAG
jgi:bifunctional non-homologous end joining protein LigD